MIEADDELISPSKLEGKLGERYDDSSDEEEKKAEGSKAAAASKKGIELKKGLQVYETELNDLLSEHESIQGTKESKQANLMALLGRMEPRLLML